MLRVRIISNIAVKLDFFSVKKKNKFIALFQDEITTNPEVDFLDWIGSKRILNDEQFATLTKKYLSSRLMCKRCDHSFSVNETDYKKPLLCPNCGSEALDVLVMREGKYIVEDSKSISTEALDIEQTDPLFVGEDTDSDEFVPAQIINKNLKIIDKVGQGGMGMVYKAKHMNLDVYRAVKVLSAKMMKNKDQERRFVREARSAAVLDHQNIVKVHNVDKEEDRWFIEMEWVEGESIQDKIKRSGSLSLEEAVDFTIQAARGMSSAHRKGIIHRDIKPDNLMVTVENVVKVADFGLAKPSETPSDLKISQSGTILGTPYYMSPEQAQNKELTAATDIYSLGVSFYHMLTGEVPYFGESAIQVLFQHIKAPFPSIRKKIANIPVELDNLILRMTAKNPEMRPPSLIEVIDELEEIRTKYDIVPIRYTDFRAYNGKMKKFKTIPVKNKKHKLPMLVFLLIALIFLFAGIGFLWWEFGNLRELYENSIKPNLQNGTQQNSDETPEVEPESNSKETKAYENTEVVKPTEDQTKIKRNNAARQEFIALRDSFTGRNYTQYINGLQALRGKYEDTLMTLEIDAEIIDAKKNRETAAESWWLKNKDKYEQHVESKFYSKAFNIITMFPNDFSETKTSKSIEGLITEIQKDVQLEQDAEIPYQEFLEFTKLELLKPEQIKRIEEIRELLTTKFSTTRYYDFVDEIDDFIELSKENYDAEQKRLELEKNTDAYDEIETKFKSLVASKKFQEAIDYLMNQEDKFDKNSSWRIKIDALKISAQDQVQELFDKAVKNAEALAKDDKIIGADGAEGVLNDVASWALEPMKAKASELLQEYYLVYITNNLDLFLTNEKFETGEKFCENLLKETKFSKHLNFILYRQKEFILLGQGFIKINTSNVRTLNLPLPKALNNWDVGDFYISKFEITNKQFQEFLEANGYETESFWSKEGWKLNRDGKFKYAGASNAPKSWGGSKCSEEMLNQPVTGISYFEAEAFCKYKGWQLPTKRQWQIAAGWDDENKSWRKYPWGSDFNKDQKYANIGSEAERGKIANVGSYAKDKSAFGLSDCAGNVREWLISSNSSNAIVMGGHFLNTHEVEDAKIIKSSEIKKTQRESYTGFRCVATLKIPY